MGGRRPERARALRRPRPPPRAAQGTPRARAALGPPDPGRRGTRPRSTWAPTWRWAQAAGAGAEGAARLARRHLAPLLAELDALGFAWELLLHRAPTISGAHGEVQRVLRVSPPLARGGARQAARPVRRAQRPGAGAARGAPEARPGRARDRPAATLVQAIVAARPRGLSRRVRAHRGARRPARRPRHARRAARPDSAGRARLGRGHPAALAHTRHRQAAGRSPRAPFRWLQLKEELERRAARSLATLQAERERCTGELHQATSELIEARAWLAQSRRMTLASSSR